MPHGTAGLRPEGAHRFTLYEARLLSYLLLLTGLIDHSAINEPLDEVAPLLQRRTMRSSSRNTISTSTRSSPDELLKHSLKVLPAHARGSSHRATDDRPSRGSSLPDDDRS